MHFVKSTLLFALISSSSLLAHAEETVTQEADTDIRKEASYEPTEGARIEGESYDSMVVPPFSMRTHVVNADVAGHDWRHDNSWKGSDLFLWVLQNQAHRSFNFYTYGPNKLWFNYQLNWNSRLIQYQVVDSRSGQTLQAGTTTATMQVRSVYYPIPSAQAGYNPHVPQVEFAFDVDFRPETRMRKHFYVRSERKNIFWAAEARGYIASAPNYNQFVSDFEVLSGWARP